MSQSPSRPDAVRLGRLIHAFIRAGWRPPKPGTRQTLRIIEDIERVSGASLALSPTQTRCLELYAEGLTKEQVGEVLGIGLETVKTRMKDAQSRLGARNMTHAVAIAIRDGHI